ncbi:hypothetical protein DXG03_005702, partial [Asterophora parasitica]
MKPKEFKKTIKKSSDMPATEGFYSGIAHQALMYMRRTLAEQIDRNFIIGLAICYEDLVVLLLDRSGILQSYPINIGEEPKTFIRVIAGLRCMSPEQLGWDTTMKLYQQVGASGIYTENASYESGEIEAIYRSHWAIDVIVDSQIEKYITVRTISAMRAAETCGRSTVIFEVVKLADLLKHGSDAG